MLFVRGGALPAAVCALGFLFTFLPAVRAVDLDIPVFSGGYGTAFYEETARQFEALHPGVSIRLYGDPRIADQVSVRVIAGQYPDATSAGYVPWPSLIKAGKVLDLTPYLDGPNWEGNARWGTTFFPGALDSWKVGGRIRASVRLLLLEYLL